MSRENLEVVRRAIDAFNGGGIDAALQFFDEQIEWTTTGIFLEAGQDLPNPQLPATIGGTRSRQGCLRDYASIS
jgi:ketosteroid isomerase-like protein